MPSLYLFTGIEDHNTSTMKKEQSDEDDASDDGSEEKWEVLSEDEERDADTEEEPGDGNGTKNNEEEEEEVQQTTCATINCISPKLDQPTPTVEKRKSVPRNWDLIGCETDSEGSEHGDYEGYVAAILNLKKNEQSSQPLKVRNLETAVATGHRSTSSYVYDKEKEEEEEEEKMKEPKKGETPKKRNSHITHEYEQTFQQRCEELKEYHAKNGNFNVPKKYGENMKLAHFVGNLKSGNYSLTDERRQMLQSMGFTGWKEKVKRKRKRDRKGNRSKEDREEEDKYHRRKKKRQQSAFSDDDHSEVEDGTLQKYGKEKKRYERKKEKGFAKWDERISELRAFKKKYGHCNIPTHYSKSPKLSSWLNGLRWRWTHWEGYLSTEQENVLIELGITKVKVRRNRRKGSTDDQESESSDGERRTRARRRYSGS